MGTDRFVSQLAFGCAYFLVASATIAITRFDGGIAYIWAASALLLARLHTLDHYQWKGYIIASAAGSVLATGLFGMGWPAAAPMAVINMGEAVLAAIILGRAKHLTDTDALAWLRYLVLAAVISATCGAFGAAGVAQLTMGASPVVTVLHWVIGHSLGVLTFAPLFSQAFTGRLRSWWQEQVVAEPGTTLALLVGMLVVTMAAFYQQDLPLLFMPLLPLVLMTYRLRQLGAVFGMIILVIVGTVATAHGRGPIQLAALSLAEQLQFLQFYFAGAVLTVLPLSAILSRRDHLFGRLLESEARYRMLADHSADIIVTLDLEGRFQFVSPSIARQSGYAPDEVLGQSPLEIIQSGFHDAVRAAHHATLTGGGDTVRVEYLARLKSGELRWFETHQRAILDDFGNPKGVVGFIRDIHERKVQETQLAAEAATDPLTGAPNRRVLIGTLEDAIAQGRGGVVAMLDLDNFKSINDRFGHAVGDATLRLFAETASAMIRDNDTFARIGGEEFALYLPHVTQEQARQVCQRLLDAFGAIPIPGSPDGVCATVSAGLTTLRASCAETLKRADIALYLAKHRGRDQLAIAA